MLEDEYWEILEYRISLEMKRVPESRALGLWCDGFMPEEYILSGAGRHIRGMCWIGLGSKKQEQWRFKLILKDHISKHSEIYWSYFMPPDNVSGWLRVFPKEKYLEIDPRAGKISS